MVNKYRYFGGFLNRQENFLNKMASKGYRLIKVGKLKYTFEKTLDKSYQYAVDFVADKNHQQSRDYKSFLEDMGYKVFYKNLNLDLSLFKVKLRPMSNKGGKLAHSGTTYNKELIIVEKLTNSSEFKLHTTREDKLNYYKTLRNFKLTPLILSTGLFAYILYDGIGLSLIMLLAILIFVESLIPALLYQYEIIKLGRSNLE